MTTDEYQYKRLFLYRKYKSLLKSLNVLLSNGIIEKLDFEQAKIKVETLYEEMKSDRKSQKPSAIRLKGRPKHVSGRPILTICKAQGCSNPPAPGHVYCSPECAPFGKLNIFGKKGA